MRFLIPEETNPYFGGEDFHLQLKRTTPEMPEMGMLPSYYFDMMVQEETVGQCALRIGDGEIARMVGNIGYQVKEEHRGKGYAVAACYLLCSLARRHGMKELFITCTPDNHPSQRVCEKIGAKFRETVDVPDEHDPYQRGKKKLMQYVLKIQPIRPATEQDIPTIAALYDRITEREAKGTNYSGWAQGEYPMEWTARELLEAGGLYCMTDQSGKVVASAAYDNRHDSCYDDVVWGKDIPSEQTLCIHTLAIDPDCRGQGLGEAMMRFGFEMAEKLGLKGIRIDTWVENTPALKFYHKLGYRDVAVLSDNVHYEGDRMAYQFLEWYR